jgi:hypothetical protein
MANSLSKQVLRLEELDGFLILDRRTLQEIRHADALALWVRLQSCREGWKIWDAWLKKELRIGDVRLKSAKDRLRDLGLWEVRHLRDPETGRMKGSEVYLRARIPSESQGNPSPEETRDSVNPSSGVSTPLNNNKENKEKEKPGEAGKRSAHKSSRLSFESEFGLEWQPAWSRYLDENRVVVIFKKHDTTDPEQVRRLVAEWATSCFRHKARGEACDPARLLIHLIKKQTSLIHTAEGDERLPSWA